MLRYGCGSIIPSARASTKLQVLNRSFVARAGTGHEEDELSAARQWLSTFSLEKIPKKIGEITFSRSSGPGGQNVNKVNSKATLRVSLPAILQLIPNVMHPAIRQSRYCNSASDFITIQSDDSRKQSDNKDSCFLKLHDIIVEAGSKAIPRETSDAQKDLVKGYQKAADRRRLAAKKQQSSKKSSRKGGGSSDY